MYASSTVLYSCSTTKLDYTIRFTHISQLLHMQSMCGCSTAVSFLDYSIQWFRFNLKDKEDLCTTTDIESDRVNIIYGSWVITVQCACCMFFSNCVIRSTLYINMDVSQHSAQAFTVKRLCELSCYYHLNGQAQQ